MKYKQYYSICKYRSWNRERFDDKDDWDKGVMIYTLIDKSDVMKNMYEILRESISYMFDTKEKKLFKSVSTIIDCDEFFKNRIMSNLNGHEDITTWVELKNLVNLKDVISDRMNELIVQ